MINVPGWPITIKVKILFWISGIGFQFLYFEKASDVQLGSPKQVLVSKNTSNSYHGSGGAYWSTWPLETGWLGDPGGLGGPEGFGGSFWPGGSNGLVDLMCLCTVFHKHCNKITLRSDTLSFCLHAFDLSPV